MLTSSELNEILPLQSDVVLRETESLCRRLRRERACRRHVERHWKDGMYAAETMMTGVVHAMLCRAFLRWSKGLPPFAARTNGRLAATAVHRETGGTPSHGRMWTAAEGAHAANLSRWKAEEPGIAGLSGVATTRFPLSPLTLSARWVPRALREHGYPWPTSSAPHEVIL